MTLRPVSLIRIAGIVLVVTAGCVYPTPAPLAAEPVPADKYLFIDHHINVNGVTINGTCYPAMNLDFPMYSFDKKPAYCRLHSIDPALWEKITW